MFAKKVAIVDKEQETGDWIQANNAKQKATDAENKFHAFVAHK